MEIVYQKPSTNVWCLAAVVIYYRFSLFPVNSLFSSRLGNLHTGHWFSGRLSAARAEQGVRDAQG